MKSLPLTLEEAEAVYAELDAILRSPNFGGSKRCHDFLTFIVKRTLDGQSETLTERFIGADLFGRPINYDTTTDSIVRVRANDVRRRLNEFYVGPRSPSPVKISLSSGHYVPQFHWASAESPGEAADVPVEGSPSQIPGKILYARLASMLRSRKALAGLVIATLLLAVTGAFLFRGIMRSSPASNAMQRFWQPLVDNHAPVVLCFSDTYSYWLSPAMRKAADENSPLPSLAAGQIAVTRDDAASSGNIRAALGIMTILNSQGVRNVLRWPQELQASELEKENVVFIGGFSNPGTMNLNENLPFTFKRVDAGDQSTWMIVDRASPSHVWSTTKTFPASVDYDYAMITRIIDHDRKRVVLSVGGLNMFGTQAAGEFLTNEAAMNQFARTAPKDWENKNLQIVLQMGVTGRNPINPQIVASKIW